MMRWLPVLVAVLLDAAPAQADPISLAVGVAISAIGGASVSAIALNLVASVVLSGLSRMLAPKASRGGLDSGVQDMVRQPVTARRTIYGRQLVSGPIVYVETYGEIDGLPRIYLSLVVALAGHECDAIEEVRFNDQTCQFLTADHGGMDTTDCVGSPFSSKWLAGSPDTLLAAEGINFAHVYRHLGAADQAADSQLVKDSTKWTTAHRLRGVCYIHARLRFDRLDKIFHDGVPEILCLVRGKKILDTRTATTAWSENPALCAYDYLTAVLGVPAASIDTASVNAAANVCDELVTIKAGTTEKRYTCNGTVDADQRPADVLGDLLGSMAGTLTYSGGKFYLHAGAAVAATVTITDAMLKGPIQGWPKTTKRELFNGAKAIFRSREDLWQPKTTPVVTNAAYVAQDNGIETTPTFELPFVDKQTRAQRLVKIELERARQQQVFDVTTDLSGLALQVWDTVQWTRAAYGFSAKKFRVMRWTLNESLTVGLTLREEADAVWTFTAAADEQDVDPAPDTNLGRPFDVTTPGTITVTEDLRESNGNVVVVLEIAAGDVADGDLDAYEAQIRRTLPSATAWKSLGTSTTPQFEFSPALDGATYEIRVRTRNAIGARSAWLTVTHQVAGQATRPDDVADFRVDIRGAEAWLAWTAVTDADLAHYRIRWTTLTAGATWQNAVDLVPRVAKPATSLTVPAIVGTYLIKAIDQRGNESANAAAVVSTIAGVAGLNLVGTMTESPDFAGTHDGTVAVDDALKLDTTNLWDSGAGNVDAMTGLVDAGGGTGNVQAQGYYYFDQVFDLGARYTSRVTASLQMVADDYTSLFDDAPESFDDRAGDFDGSIVTDVNAGLEVRTTDDDPAGSPAWSDWLPFVVGEHTARAFDFRAALTTLNGNASPKVPVLAVSIDMPDREAMGTFTTSAAGAVTVTYDKPFKGPTSGGFTAPPVSYTVNLATGEYVHLFNETVDGFDIEIFNAGGSRVAKSGIYRTRGYGMKEAA